MRRGFAVLLGSCVVLAGVTFGVAGTEMTNKKQAKIDAQKMKIDAVAQDALEMIKTEKPKAKELFDKAYGWAAFDNLKLGFIVSGGGGKGVAVEKESNEKTYMNMGTGGMGLTFGGQKYQVVFLFQDEKTFKEFIDNGWTADLSAQAAIPTGGAGAGTKFVNGIAIYQISAKGLMASADIAGTRYWKDKDLN